MKSACASSAYTALFYFFIIYFASKNVVAEKETDTTTDNKPKGPKVTDKVLLFII
jgi:hypothetical protein